MQCWALHYGFVTWVFSFLGTCSLAHCLNKASSPPKCESHKVEMHLCHGVGSVGRGSVLNISAPLIFAFHSKPWKGKVTKCMFTRSTQPAQLQLSPNLVLPSFSGLAGKYRFSRYLRHIIYLIKCVFWHVHYLPDGLTDGREQTLSFVQTATLFMGGESSVSPCPFRLHVWQWAHPTLHHRAKSKRRRGEAGHGNQAGEGHVVRWSSCPEPRAVGPTVGMDLNIYAARYVCVYVYVCVYIYIHTVRGGTHILVREDWIASIHLFCYRSLYPAM